MRKTLILLLAFLLLSGCMFQPKESELTVAVLDVGNADCSIIKSPNGQAIIIDTGAYTDFDKIKAFLEEEKITSVQALIISHPNAEHMGCAAKLIREYHIPALYMNRIRLNTTPYTALLSTAEAYGTSVTYVAGGESFEFDGVTVNFFATSAVFESLGDSSLLTQVVYGVHTFLFAGDITENAEYAFSAKYGKSLSADFLKVPNHAGAHSCSDWFLKLINPNLCVIPCNNAADRRYPDSSALRRLGAVCADILRTDKHGTVKVYTEGTGSLKYEYTKRGIMGI